MANDKLRKSQAEDALMAILALGTSTPKDVDKAVNVSQEDLMALWNGNIDAARRRQLLDVIVASPDYYLQWVQLIEAQDALTATDEADASITTEKRRDIAGFWIMIMNRLGRPWVLGGAVAALLVVFLLPLQSQRTSDSRAVDRFYDQWYPGAPTTATQSQQWRGGVSSNADKPEEQRYFEAGMLAGLKRLGDGFEIVGLPAYKLAETDTSSQAAEENQVFLRGRMTTILYFRCANNQDWTSEDIKFFQTAQSLLSNIEEGAPNWRYFKSSEELTQMGSQPQDLPSILCSKSLALVQKVIRLNH